MNENGIPLCGVYIDKEGVWFFKGAEICSGLIFFS